MKIVKINFLGKNYEIKCGDDEEQKIRILEARLNDKVNKDINKKNNFTDTHRLLLISLSLEDQINELLKKEKIILSKFESEKIKNEDLSNQISYENSDFVKDLDNISIKINNILSKIENFNKK
ncbi:MAG: hypothetical protein CFH21_00642 [Alphaproteobacteria bacterium MarineAlpha5_Bin11]|nr:hypothetical protein [Pelagibacteraceae bacterium]PPR43846.1 MAG: hypothetical protein CFH21_00642 [Alphaproteobacteria bacterium MarineAlpha5_Bin11]|tara:strand:+ start:12704 stop:13072 length:369 start_codon:yes stop_codon:yes gene_type:complete